MYSMILVAVLTFACGEYGQGLTARSALERTQQIVSLSARPVNVICSATPHVLA